MLIDAFTHILPASYVAALDRLAVQHDLDEAWRGAEALHNTGLRLEAMEKAGVAKQVLTLAAPPIDYLAETPEAAYELSIVANDGLAEVVRQHPDRFLGVGTVALVEPDKAIIEAERCIRDLRFVGIQIFSNVHGRPIDDPSLEDFYTRITELGVPLWLHPYRPSTWSEYPAAESHSRYRLWFSLGWPIDTTIAMARLALSGVLERHPRLKIVVHHAGALIPALSNRLTTAYRQHDDHDTSPPVEQLRRFYVDTVVTTGGAEALARAVDFFGSDHVVFGSDYPFGGDGGLEYVNFAKEAVAGLAISSDERADIRGSTLLRIANQPGG